MNNRRTFIKHTALAMAGTSLATSTDMHAQSTQPSTKQTEPSLFHQRLLECLGGDWPAPDELKTRVTKTERLDGFKRLKLSYELEAGDRCPAILLVPDGVDANHPAPAIAVWHQHNGEYHLGKSEPAGLAGNPMHYTGVELAKLGYVVLCPDALCFEERQDPEGKLKGSSFERFEFLRYTVDGRCMAWKNILDMRRAIDFLVSLPEVDGNRLGCYGHSMGSTHTWLVGPFEPRLKALVGNCCLPTYAGIHRTKLLHCFPNFIPGIHQFGDTPDIAALIAPRALHLNLGETDSGSPIEEARAGVETIRQAYEKAGANDQFSAFIQSNTGHVLSPEMWAHTKAFFARHLLV